MTNGRLVATLEGGLNRGTFDVWALVIALFAPWWLAGFWIGGGTKIASPPLASGS